MTNTLPILCRWTGEHFTPANQFWTKRAARQFAEGELYPLEAREDRTPESHRHFFAAVKEAWVNLPERYAEMLPSPEHLRKYALIKCGFRDERSIVCSSRSEAQRIASFVRPMDEFAVVIVRGAVVVVFTAKSQSMRAMKKREFLDSARQVLEFCSSLIGTSADDLKRAGEAA